MASKNQDVFERALFELSKHRVRKAAIRALNKSATSVSAFIAKEVRAKYKVKSSETKAAIKVKKAKAAGARTLGELAAGIEISQKGLPLSTYGARPKVVTLQKKTRRARLTSKGIRKVAVRQKRIGVTVNVKGQRKLVKGAFMATLSASTGRFSKGSAGTLKVFRRVGKGRFPIKLLYGPSVRDMMGEEFVKKVQAFARERVATVFRQEINYELTKPLTQTDGGNAA